MLDLAKVRRETLRWMLLLTLNHGRPVNTHENTLLGVARAEYADASLLEIRRELDYLEERRLIEIARDPAGPWSAGLTRTGIDYVEYTIPGEPGIARPNKYWPS